MIEKLWNGNIAPGVMCGKFDPQIIELTERMERQKTILERELDPQRREIFERFADCAEEYTSLISGITFRDGFRLAVSLMTEALSPDM